VECVRRGRTLLQWAFGTVRARYTLPTYYTRHNQFHRTIGEKEIRILFLEILFKILRHYPSKSSSPTGVLLTTTLYQTSLLESLVITFNPPPLTTDQMAEHIVSGQLRPMFAKRNTQIYRELISNDVKPFKSLKRADG
jgi:hypothetical protein